VEDIALLSTTSQGLNLVPSGLDWRAGDEVVLYEMDHPTDIYAWLNLADRGVTMRFIKDRGGRYDAEDLEQLIGPRTRAVCLSLVNYGTGFRAPVEAIGEICRRRGVWFVVDAIMALGALRVRRAGDRRGYYFSARLQVFAIRLRLCDLLLLAAGTQRAACRGSRLQGDGTRPELWRRPT
jgi:selenocysteine lyase/cysteine desulfurase